MFDRFPRPSLASSLSFFPRSLLLKCVAAVPAAAGLSSWTSNILSTSLSVWVCVYVYVCKCMCVCGKSVEKNNNSPEGFSCSCSVCIYEIPPRGLSTALGHTQKPPCPFSRASYGEPGLQVPWALMSALHSTSPSQPQRLCRNLATSRQPTATSHSHQRCGAPEECRTCMLHCILFSFSRSTGGPPV